ncbi:MAG: hypothetical protein SGI74_01695 [Oligoflexia bacterium]|nr:hypothetical protein [Oligoflexia bacterium]
MSQGLLGLLIVLILCPSKALTASVLGSDFLKKLAIYHAPVIYQEIGKNPRADAITRFNFDGDWVGNNNWDNLEKYPTPAYVYYDVVETSTHYFITYAFFHPRDYQAVCFWKFCHENDLEGAFYTVVKNPSHEMGDVVYISTVAHYDIIGYANPKTTVAPAPDLSGRDRRIALRIDSGGHAVYNWDDLPNNNPRLIYSIGTTADDPNGKKNGTYRYLLTSMSDLWSRKDHVGRGKIWNKNFKYGGTRFQIGDVPEAFAGEKFGRGLAKPPWAWFDDTDSSYSKRGDWFFDPAYMVFMRLGQPRGWSLEYIHNPYVGIVAPDSVSNF